MNRLKEYRERYGLTQPEVVAEIRRRARERGDIAVPGLDRPALSRHENGHKRPGPYYQWLYCEIYGATPAELGFRLALPGEKGHHEDVDRREFLTGAAGFVAAAALPSTPTQRLGGTDVARLQQSVIQLYMLGDQHGGAGAVYPLTVRTFDRLRGLMERASYDAATGQALCDLAGQTARRAGSMAFDADRPDDARRWWLEAMHWARLAEADSVGISAIVAMAYQAADQGRPREVIDLATAAQRTAGRAATPRLTSILLAREALGHAGRGDTTSAHAALRRGRALADRPPREGDLIWLNFYGPADFAAHEHRVALMLGDTAAAEGAARDALALNDPVAYPRNHALYMIWLADVLAQRRKIDEAAAVASQAAVAAADLDSGRVKRGLRAVAQRLAPYRGDAGVNEFLALV